MTLTDIVIVDDEEDILEFLEIYFQQKGFNAKGFISLEGAKEFIFEHDEVKAIVIDKEDVPSYKIEEFKKDLENRGFKILFFYIDKNKSVEEVVKSLSDLQRL